MESLQSPEFKKLLDSLPELPIYQQQIFDFLKLDKSAMSLSEISKRFIGVAKLIPQIVQIIEKSIINKMHLYRVRIVKQGQQSFDKKIVRSFSYPDPSINLENNRANIAGTTVFYCATDWQTAIRETNPQPGDICYVSSWNINCDRDVIYRAFLPHQSMPKESQFTNLGLKHFDEYKKWNRENDIEKEEHMNFLYNVIAEQFGFEQSPYSFSSWLANKLIYQVDGIDFLLYPSWKTQFVGCNFALHPNFVDQYLSLERIFEITVDEIIHRDETNHDHFKWSFGQIGQVYITNIQWWWPSMEELNLLNRDSGPTYEINFRPKKSRME